MEQIYGYTAPGASMPPFIAFHASEDGDKCTINVRAHGGPYASIDMPKDDALALALSIINRLNPTMFGTVSDAQVKQMVNRFLAWHLPENFRPDGGISFDPVANRGNEYEMPRDPTGTNLFDYNQATEMVKHMIGSD